MEKLFFLGANNPETARIMAAVSRVRNVAFEGFIDNDPAKKNTRFCGLPVFGGFDVLPSLDRSWRFVNLITRDARTRFETTRAVQQAGFELGSLIHPSIDLTLTEIGPGAYLQEAVVVQAEVTLNENCSIHMGSLIGHETTVGAHSFIAHGVTVSGLVTIGAGCFVGAGSTILPRVSIDEGCIIGAGAVVTKDVSAFSVVVGNPGRVIRTVPPFSLT